MILKYTYIVTGAAMSRPHVCVISQAAADAMNARVALATKDELRESVYRSTFGLGGIHAALPAWVAECLVWIVEHYEGPHKEQVQGLAACILTDTPFAGDDEEPRGGPGVGVVPNQPLSPSPVDGQIVEVRP